MRLTLLAQLRAMLKREGEEYGGALSWEKEEVVACVSLPVRLPKTAAAWRLVGSCFAADDDDDDADDWKVTGQNGSKYSMVCVVGGGRVGTGVCHPNSCLRNWAFSFRLTQLRSGDVDVAAGPAS